MIYKGHIGKVTSLSVDPTGQWIASGNFISIEQDIYHSSGSDDFTVRVWEIDTGRCLSLFQFEGIVFSVQWNPDPAKNILAVAR